MNYGNIMAPKLIPITVRVDEGTYKLLTNMANRRNESISRVTRRVITQSLQTEVATDAQDALVSIVRKAIALELRKTENRLASLSSKAAITSASTENLVSYVLKLLHEPNITGVREACRKRGVAYIREPLNQIMQAFPSESEEDKT